MSVPLRRIFHFLHITIYERKCMWNESNCLKPKRTKCFLIHNLVKTMNLQAFWSGSGSDESFFSLVSFAVPCQVRAGLVVCGKLLYWKQRPLIYLSRSVLSNTICSNSGLDYTSLSHEEKAAIKTMMLHRTVFAILTFIFKETDAH